MDAKKEDVPPFGKPKELQSVAYWYPAVFEQRAGPNEGDVVNSVWHVDYGTSVFVPQHDYVPLPKRTLHEEWSRDINWRISCWIESAINAISAVADWWHYDEGDIRSKVDSMVDRLRWGDDA